MESPLISLKDYLTKNKPIIIPYYQRGYVWGKSRGTEKDSVQFLIESIKNYYNNDLDLFIQGLTVCENISEIELIDGQQRTTVLYLLLQYLGYKGEFSINYRQIRTQSHDFLDLLKNKKSEEILLLCSEGTNEEYQDIYYFKKSIRIIHDELKGYDHAKLISFLLEKVKFLYIDIPRERASTVFSMMNGNKAEMRHEEIIKAEMLRLVSTREENQKELSPEEIEALRWDQNLTRSKYAREWDKWLYWWNQPDVKKFYHTSNVMGLLVETFFYASYPKLKFNFENFRDKFLRGKDNTFLSKEVFYKLRQLQKKFEDIYNSYGESIEIKRLHNKIGAILTLLNPDDCKKFIRLYFIDPINIDIDEYLKLVYLGLNFSQIEKVIKNDEDSVAVIQQKKEELLKAIESNNLYYEDNIPAFIQLLRRNLEEDTKLGRKFDFSIWGEKSLEHIHPKSKVFYRENGFIKNGNNEIISETIIDSTYLDGFQFEKNGSEHCIGNLVLLYKNENSSFGAKDFNGKKSLYFDLTRDATFRSRHLLHTISVFAREKWGVKEIQQNKENFIKEVKAYYGIQ